MTTIETDRLLLRPLARSDAAAISRLLLDDPEAVRMTARIPEPCTPEAALAWIRLRVGPGEHTFAMETRDGDFVGCMGLVAPGGDVGAMGYWVGRPWSGRGFATEAGHAALEHARRLGLATVLAEALPDNGASLRVLEKLGFEPDGALEKDLPERGGRRLLLRFRRRL